MMTRDEAKDLVLDYAYGELAPDVAAGFEVWLEQDPDLQARLDEIRLVRGFMVDMPAERLPNDVHERVMAAARAKASRMEVAGTTVGGDVQSTIALIRDFLASTFMSPAFFGTAAVLVAVGLSLQLFVDLGSGDRLEMADREERVAALRPKAPVAMKEGSQKLAEPLEEEDQADEGYSPAAPAMKALVIEASPTKAVQQSVEKESIDSLRLQGGNSVEKKSRGARPTKKNRATRRATERVDRSIEVSEGALSDDGVRFRETVKGSGGVARGSGGTATILKMPSEKKPGEPEISGHKTDDLVKNRKTVSLSDRLGDGRAGVDADSSLIALRSVAKTAGGHASKEPSPPSLAKAESVMALGAAERVEAEKPVRSANTAKRRAVLEEQAPSGIVNAGTGSSEEPVLETRLANYDKALKEPNLSEERLVDLLAGAADVAIRLGRYDLARDYVGRLEKLPGGHKIAKRLKKRLK